MEKEGLITSLDMVSTDTMRMVEIGACYLWEGIKGLASHFTFTDFTPVWKGETYYSLTRVEIWAFHFSFAISMEYSYNFFHGVWLE